MISSSDITRSSMGWFCQAFLGSLCSCVIERSSGKAACQNQLDSIDLGSHSALRYSGDFSDRGSIHAFQVQEHDLPFGWLQLLNELQQPSNVDSFSGGSFVVTVWCGFDL